MRMSGRTVPPPPTDDAGWFRVPHSDAGLGGPGWMRVTSQGNDYRSDRVPTAAGYTITCTRASLAGLAPCSVTYHQKRPARPVDWRTLLVGLTTGGIAGALVMAVLR